MSSLNVTEADSLDDAALTAQAIAIFEQCVWSNYSFVVMFTLLLYEYVITFDREVSYAWGRRLTWARALFFLNRYVTLFQYFIEVLSGLLPQTYFSCEFLQRIAQACIITIFVVWAGFSGLRVYAISSNNTVIAVVVMLLSLIPVVTSLVLDAYTQLNVFIDFPLPVFICFPEVGFDRGTLTSLAVLTRVPLLLAEMIVIVVTVSKTWEAYIRRPRKLRYRTVVLREGALYFLAMMLLQTARLSSDILLDQSTIIVCDIAELLPPILISRFYFTLHEVRRRDIERRERARWKPLPDLPFTPSTESFTSTESLENLKGHFGFE